MGGSGLVVYRKKKKKKRVEQLAIGLVLSEVGMFTAPEIFLAHDYIFVLGIATLQMWQ